AVPLKIEPVGVARGRLHAAQAPALAVRLPPFLQLAVGERWRRPVALHQPAPPSPTTDHDPDQPALRPLPGCSTLRVIDTNGSLSQNSDLSSQGSGATSREQDVTDAGAPQVLARLLDAGAPRPGRMPAADGPSPHIY